MEGHGELPRVQEKKVLQDEMRGIPTGAAYACGKVLYQIDGDRQAIPKAGASYWSEG